MNHTAPVILIVDDEKDIRETLSAILQSQGYRTTSSASASEAIEKVKTQSFDIILLDVNLPDLEGTQLLSLLQKMVPETIKIMITGHPSIGNAAEAVNIGANSYLTKPLDPDILLETIEKKLQEREQKERITEKRLAEWVKLRVCKTQSSEFEDFLERTATILSSFALSKTAAKIYIGLNVLTVASASEVASLTKIRREEVYRTMPELEKRGLITRKFGAPMRFTAVKPRTALGILTETRIKALKEEASNLKQKKDELILQMEKTSYGMEEESSIEAFSQQDNVQTKLIEMAKRAKRQIMLASSLEQLETIFLKDMRKVIGVNPNQMSVRIIIGRSEPYECTSELDNVHTLKLLQFPRAKGNMVELRRVEVLPFNLLLVDGKEAMWGEFQLGDANRRILWTNDLTQIGILKMAYENLWLESGRIDGTINSIVGEQKATTVIQSEKGAPSSPRATVEKI